MDSNQDAATAGGQKKKHHWTVAAAASLIRVTALLTLIAFGAKFWWVSDLLTNFRVQISIGLCSLLLIVLLGRNWLWALLGAVLLLINGWETVPYLIPKGEPSVAESKQVYRLLTSNVLTSNSQHESLVKLIDDVQPDFIVVMEVNDRWSSELEKKLSEQYPHREIHPREHNFGIGIMSKIPWKEVTPHGLGEDELPWLQTKFQLDGKLVELTGVHPIPPMGSPNAEARNDQMMNVCSNVDQDAGRIITGDFNMTPWSPWFKEIMSASQTFDASTGFGLTPTWEVFPTLIGGLKIDHALISDDLEVHDFQVGPNIGSDHRPIIVDFSVK